MLLHLNQIDGTTAFALPKAIVPLLFSSLSHRRNGVETLDRSTPSRRAIAYTSRPSCARIFMSSESGSPANGDSLSDSNSKSNNATEPCTYCHDKMFVTCPVCEGRGYMGRTITCYYCRGKEIIECPLCIDDVYRLSYTPQQPESNADEMDDDQAEEKTSPIAWTLNSEGKI